jgi:hypothetical protein
MKAKFLLFVVSFLIGVTAMAQPKDWTESLYTSTKTSVFTLETGMKTEGLASLKYTFTDDGTPWFICDTIQVKAGETYNYSIDYLDNDPSGTITARVYFFTAPNTAYLSRSSVSAPTVDSPNWQKISLTGTTPDGATLAYVIIRMSAATAWNGSATFWADNAVYTEGASTTNLIKNGGFEDWVIPADAVLANWTESLYDVKKTSTISRETTQKTEGLSSLKYTFTDDGTPWLICDTIQVKGGETYNYSIDYLDNDPAGTETARIYFFTAPNTDYLSRSSISAPTVDSPNWQTISLTGTTPATATLAYVIIRMEDVAASWTGSATFYADNAKYTEGTGTKNLIKNGGFDNWVIGTLKPVLSSEKDMLSFKFDGLTPPVSGVISAANKTITIEVPKATNLTNLIPTITVSPEATISPKSGVAADFTNPVSYIVTAQDGSTQTYIATVKPAAEGQTVLFSETFDNLLAIPSNWVIINNDGYKQASGEERWQDSAWVVSISSRAELKGTKIAMASSYTDNMPLDGRADDWMILPEISLGGNSILSWQAMSTTSSGKYPDDYKVYIAPSTSGVTPTVAYFEENGNLLISVAPESWSAGVGNPGKGLASHTLNLKKTITPDAPSGWFDRKVWIAFVLTTDLYTNPTTGVPNGSAGGSELALDNIKVVNDLGTSITANNLDTFDSEVYPNPASNEINFVFYSQLGGKATIRIHDLAGREVMNISRRTVSGKNSMKMDVTALKRGVYMMQTITDNKTNVTKLIIQK